MSSTPATTAAATTHSSGASGANHGVKRGRAERSGWRNLGTSDMPLRKYTPTPTLGTARLHNTQDFGHADFYPAKPLSGENQLTERTIRYGYVDPLVVENEYQSNHEVVYLRLQDTRVFQELQMFAAGVAQKQGARGNVAGKELPRLPNRAVKTEEQRDEWVRALANPRVPLSVLVGRTPFGLRGDRLLDALSQNQVPLQRALWAIRLVGVYEMLGMQTREPDLSGMATLASQFTVQWSKQFMQFVERTLAAAPTEADTSTSASSWAQNWAFCLGLFHAQYSHGLVDQRHMVSWLVGLLRQLPVDKCMLALPLLADYASEIGKSRNPLRKLISATVFRIDHATKYPALERFQTRLCKFLLSLFIEYPDAFVEPTTWMAYRAALVSAGHLCNDDVQPELRRLLAVVDKRNRCFDNLLPVAEVRKPTGKENSGPLKVLGAMSPDTDVALLFSELFSRQQNTSPTHTIRLICYWAVEDYITGFASQFRTLVAARLCRLYLDQPSVALADVQRAVIGFLDIIRLPKASDSANDVRKLAIRRTCLLLERLADVGCFSISRYLQLLTARGDFFGTNSATVRSQRHLEYVTNMACRTVEELDQRHMLLRDCNNGVSMQDEVSERLKADISALLPFMMAYTCAAPLRARDNERKPSVGLDVVQWWMPVASGGGDLFDPKILPAPVKFAPTLSSSLAQVACTKDWIAPVPDHADDHVLLGRGFSAHATKMLATGSRGAVHHVVGQLMPVVYDYVVKEVKVGVDNWRVITRPGTSLLNRRQAAVVICVLVDAECFAQLLDFLFWILNHTRVVQVSALAHHTLRRFAHVWRLLGRLPMAVADLSSLYDAGTEGFDFEVWRTAQCWAELDKAAAGLFARVGDEYQQYVVAQQLVFQPASQPPGQQPVAGSELLQLARQLVNDADAHDWAISPCFQKLLRCAQASVQRHEFASTPAPMQYDVPNSPGSVHMPRLRSVFAQMVSDATHAAMQATKELVNVEDDLLVRCMVELCALYVRWAAVGSGLVLAPEYATPLLLNAMESAIDAWTLGTVADIDAGLLVAQLWTTGLVANGCLRIDDLVPWAIEKCKQDVMPQSIARFACLAGVVRALGMPTDSSQSDTRLLHETLAIGASWTSALVNNRVTRIQSIELVFTSASASGRLRVVGAPLHLSAALMRAAAELAQSKCIQQIVDYVPAHDTAGGRYYTLLEIYRANIERQINDPRAALPVKRATLRALLTLCEGVDPETDGFSAMTTAEVAHRIHESIRRFWYGPAIKGGTAPAVAKLATILNSLLLFASTALQESEATTDAFAIAAGAGLSDPGSGIDSQVNAHQDTDHLSQVLSRDSEHVQFVTNATAYLSNCVHDAVLHWDLQIPELLAVLPRKSAGLSAVLVTLSSEVLVKLVEACAAALFSLNMSHLRVAAGCVEKVTADQLLVSSSSSSLPLTSQDSLVLNRRVAAIVDASRIDVPAMMAPMLAMSDPDAVDSMGCSAGDCSDPVMFSSEASVRGSALATMLRQLHDQLAQSIQTTIPGDPPVFASSGLLASVRDFAAGILAQLQCIAVVISPTAARQLSLRMALRPLSQNSSPQTRSDGVYPSDECLRMAILWRLQAVQPFCGLMRMFPEEFAVGEWLLTLVTLCLSSLCQDSQKDTLYGFLLDFAAIINESITAGMRKHTLGLLKSVTPLLHRVSKQKQHVGVLGRLFPFDVANTLTCDIIQQQQRQSSNGLDNPWLWLEALEFVPLEPLKSTAISNAGLEGMTPFTLRGMVEQENQARAEKTSVANNTGYLASIQRAGNKPNVGVVRSLQYLENPYFPMQPAFLFPLAETPVAWSSFAAKQKRVDSETRLVWRYQCHAAFGD